MATKKNLITNVSKTTGFSKTVVEIMLNAFTTETYQSIKNEGVAVLPGIGKLKVRTRNARVGRNPRTGESLNIPETQYVKLTVGKALRTSV